VRLGLFFCVRSYAMTLVIVLFAVLWLIKLFDHYHNV
jgi:hypothetical protein